MLSAPVVIVFIYHAVLRLVSFPLEAFRLDVVFLVTKPVPDAVPAGVSPGLVLIFILLSDERLFLAHLHHCS